MRRGVTDDKDAVSPGNPEMVVDYGATHAIRRTVKPLSEKTRSERAKSMAPAVEKLIAGLDAQGRWVSKGDLKKRDWEFSERAETSVFIKNAETLATYLETVGR